VKTAVKEREVRNQKPGGVEPARSEETEVEVRNLAAGERS
jgi:hypothetical protein